MTGAKNFVLHSEVTELDLACANRPGNRLIVKIGPFKAVKISILVGFSLFTKHQPIYRKSYTSGETLPIVV